MSHRPPSFRLPLLLIVGGLCLAAGPARAQTGTSYVPRPSSEVATIGVGDRDYLVLGEEPILVPLVGPGTLWGFARVGFADGETGVRSATLVLAGIEDRAIRIPLDFRPSSPPVAWGDGRPGSTSGGRRFEIHVPAGVWTVRLIGRQAQPGVLAAILYYDGPAQPAAAAGRARPVRAIPWRYRNQFGLEVIYDNNVLTQSPDYIRDFVTGQRPERFRIGKYDDLIISPSLDLAADRRFVSWGNTRLRFKIQRWIYTQNPIKTNTDLDWYVRQSFAGGKSIELNYQFAPEQYIRQLGDRSPFSDTTLPVQQKQFRFTRNVASIQWRHTLNPRFNYTLLVIYKQRNYNKPFMENDISAWEFRGALGYRPHRRLRLTIDYSFEDAQGRAMDTAGQTAATSTASDPTYVRDLYRFGFDWTTPWARPVFDAIDGSLLFMDYYFTTDRSLFADPYHTGRRDMMTRVALRASRRLTAAIRVYANFRYSDRIVDSPWPGDITIDKDYTQQRYGVGLTYQF